MTRIFILLFILISSVAPLAEEFPTRAELRTTREVWVQGEDPAAWSLVDAQGREIGVERTVQLDERTFLIHPSQDLKLDQVYFATSPASKVRCRFDGWFREVLSDKPLGADVAENGRITHFGVFSPRARS